MEDCLNRQTGAQATKAKPSAARTRSATARHGGVAFRRFAGSPKQYRGHKDTFDSSGKLRRCQMSGTVSILGLR
jgi:hypothetical protein